MFFENISARRLNLFFLHSRTNDFDLLDIRIKIGEVRGGIEIERSVNIHKRMSHILYV